MSGGVLALRFYVGLLLPVAAALAAGPSGAMPVLALDCSSLQNSAPLSVSYLSWYDNASPGFVADNIHILNPGTTPSAGCVGSGGRWVAWTANPSQEIWVSLPPGTWSGPLRIQVYSGPPVRASQRVQFHQSFSELWASTQTSTVSYFNWYDHAGPGMQSDNIHITNPGSSTAAVTVTVPGASDQKVSVAPGAGAYVSFPQGTMGSPVTVSALQPVLVSQRVQRYNSFSEIWASPASQAATKSYLNWFDTESPGMTSDNIHLFNPGTVTANVSVSIPCAYSAGPFSLAPGGVRWVGGFPFGNACGVHCLFIPAWCLNPMGGPVTINSDQPIFASQRIQFYQSFDELWSATAPQASTLSYFNWYDRASPGMVNDNIHMTNPGSVRATVTVSLPGSAPQTVAIDPGLGSHLDFGSAYGGAVTITSDQPVLVSQRVQSYNSFSEVWSG
jgi:hypothetical protein